MPEKPPAPKPPPPKMGYPQRYHDSDRVKAANATPAPSAAADSASVRVGWRGISVAIPMSLLASLVTALVTHWASPATLPPNDELRSQVREIAADVRELKHDARDTKDDLAVERSYTRRNIPVMAAVIEKACSAKFAWSEGRRPADPDWLPPPLASGPAWQPAVALLPPPTE